MYKRQVPDDVDGNADEEGEQALSETAYSLQQSIVESNPQFITLVRNEQGDLVDTVGLYASYPAFLEDVYKRQGWREACC